MNKLFSIFRKKSKQDDTPFTKEQAVAFLQTCEFEAFVIPPGYYKKTVEFLKSQLKPVDRETLIDIRTRSTKPTELFIVGHPNFRIREFDHDLFKVNIILAALPADIAKVSRNFVRYALRELDKALFIEKIDYLLSYPTHINCRCSVFPHTPTDEKKGGSH